VGHTTFDATITDQHDTTTETVHTDPLHPHGDTTIHTLARSLSDPDATRLYGDLLRYSARLEWKLVVSPLPVDRETFVRDFWEHARRDDVHEWSIHFPVTLVGRALVPTVMQGGLVVDLDCQPDRLPKYMGMSVHT